MVSMSHSRRRIWSRFVLCLVVLVGLATFAFRSFLQKSDETMNENGVVEAQLPMTEPRRADIVQPNPKNLVLDAPPVGVNSRMAHLRFFDKVSNRPLALQSLSLEVGKQRFFPIETDVNGLVKIVDLEWPIGSGVGHVGIPSAPGAPKFDVPMLETSTIGDVVSIDVPVPLNARLRIVVADKDGQLRDLDSKVDVTPYPDIPTDIKNHQREILSVARSEPSAYFRALMEMRLLRSDQRWKGIIVPTESEILIDIPYHGKVCISAHIPGAAPAAELAVATLGEIIKVELKVEPTPYLAGVLLDHEGRPVADATVYIGSATEIHEGDIISRSGFNRSAFGIVAKRDSDSARLSHKESVTTDSNGKFRQNLPFTDHVHVWAFDSSGGVGLVDVRAGSRYTAIETIELRLPPPERRPVAIRFLNRDRTAVENMKVIVNDEAAGFSLREDATDGVGNYSSKSFIAGRTYRLIIPGLRVNKEFVAIDGSEIVVQ